MVTSYLLCGEFNREEISRGKRESNIFSETLRKNLSAIDPEVMSFSFSIFRQI